MNGIQRGYWVLAVILGTITLGLVGLGVFSTYYAIFTSGVEGPWAQCAAFSAIFSLITGFSAFMAADLGANA